jgi:hypothetical protein
VGRAERAGPGDVEPTGAQLRIAVLPGIAPIEVIYRHTYDPGAVAGTVDLIWVGRAVLPGDG